MIDIQLNETFLDNAEKFTERKFTQRETLSELIKITNEYNQVEKFNELIFTAKYANGLFRSIKIGQSNSQISNLEQIKKDITDSIEKVSSLIKEILSKENSEKADVIKQKYTEIGQAQLGQLILLIDDLDQLKKYLNHLKRTS